MNSNLGKTVLEPPPQTFSAQDFFAGVHWHQKWEVFQGIFTPGLNPVNKLCTYAQLPEDLSGMRVLDVGAWNGCFSFECERRGAREVVAYSLENPQESGFDRLKALLHSKVTYVQGSVYTLSPEDIGLFDVILFFGVLYHLRYPLLAIDRLRTVSKGSIFIETHVLSDRLLLRKPLSILSRLLHLNALFKSTPLWRQYREYELHPKDQSNWFAPNLQAVIESFQSAGFEIEYLVSWAEDRATFKAEVGSQLPDRLRFGTYEGASSNAQLTGLPTRNSQLFREGTPLDQNVRP
ncbi:class I SAM-dependent methyltransferase [Leptolyngbya sp. PCC 6406]|uniref:class I SAM-dependent methyltransferase n=1 Tax=Leptolyngbya sp. PCC 6406 TaxID=1173264 RepID=UPI0002ABE361|nr:methyltransferase domain-containing protein [Leptolyngbya sp. PCC 6406]